MEIPNSSLDKFGKDVDKSTLDVIADEFLYNAHPQSAKSAFVRDFVLYIKDWIKRRDFNR